MRIRHIPLRIADRSSDGGLKKVRLGSGTNLADLGIPHVKDIKFEHYLNNPVVIYRHKQDTLPIGKVEEITYDEESESIIALFKFDEKGEEGLRAKESWEDGFLSGASVGVDYEMNLREVSLTPVPHDPTALRVAEAQADMVNSYITTGEEVSENIDKDSNSRDTNRDESSKDVKETTTKDFSMDEKEIKELLSTMLDGLKDSLRADMTEVVSSAIDQREKNIAETKAQEEAAAVAEKERMQELLKEALEHAGLSNNEEVETETETEETVEVPVNTTEETETEDSDASDKGSEVETPEAQEARLREEITQEINARNELMAVAQAFLPDDYDAEGKSNLEIIKAALGEEAENDEREDYLLGKLHVRAELRSKQNASTGQRLMTGSFTGTTPKENDSESHWQKMRDRKMNAWKNPVAKEGNN